MFNGESYGLQTLVVSSDLFSWFERLDSSGPLGLSTDLKLMRMLSIMF